MRALSEDIYYTITTQIRDTEELISNTTDEAKLKILNNELTSYLAIRDILDEGQQWKQQGLSKTS